MTLYLAANGQPFTDPDAAAFKADRMSAESGGRFRVVSFEGGYAVEPEHAASNLLGKGDDPAQVAARDDIEALADGPVETATTDPTAQAEQSFFLTLRPAWRAQLVGFFLIFFGGILMIAPAWPVTLFSADAVVTLNHRFPGVWDDVALGGLALCFIGIFVVLLRRYWRKSVISNDGVMQSVGILIFSHVSHIDMANVHVVDVRRPNLLHILLNLGTVELSTPGSAGADVAIVDVAAPKKLAAFIRERVTLAQSRRQSADF